MSDQNTDNTSTNSNRKWQTFWYDAEREKRWKIGTPAFKQCKKKKCFYDPEFSELWYKSPYKYDMVLFASELEENSIAEIKLLYSDSYEEVKAQKNKPPIVKNQNFFTYIKKKKAAASNSTPSTSSNNNSNNSAFENIYLPDSILPTNLKDCSQYDQQVHIGPFQLQVCSFKLERPVCMGIYLSIPIEVGSTTQNQSVCCLVSPTFTIKSKKPPQGGKKKRHASDVNDSNAGSSLPNPSSKAPSKSKKRNSQSNYEDDEDLDELDDSDDSYENNNNNNNNNNNHNNIENNNQKKPRLLIDTASNQQQVTVTQQNNDFNNNNNNNNNNALSDAQWIQLLQQQQLIASCLKDPQQNPLLSFINPENLGEIAQRFERAQNSNLSDISLANFLNIDSPTNNSFLPNFSFDSLENNLNNNSTQGNNNNSSNNNNINSNSLANPNNLANLNFASIQLPESNKFNFTTPQESELLNKFTSLDETSRISFILNLVQRITPDERCVLRFRLDEVENVNGFSNNNNNYNNNLKISVDSLKNNNNNNNSLSVNHNSETLSARSTAASDSISTRTEITIRSSNSESIDQVIDEDEKRISTPTSAAGCFTPIFSNPQSRNNQNNQQTPQFPNDQQIAQSPFSAHQQQLDFLM